MSINDGGPAFPRPNSRDPSSYEDPETYNAQEGMSMRDYFAAKAMAALIIDPARADQSREECAHLSYLMADSMIAARTLPVGEGAGT